MYYCSLLVMAAFAVLSLFADPLARAYADTKFNDSSIKVTVNAPVLIIKDFLVGPHSFTKVAAAAKLADGSLFVKGYRSTDGGRNWTKVSDAVVNVFKQESPVAWHAQQAVCVLRDGTYIDLSLCPEIHSLTRSIVKVYMSSDNCQIIDGPIDAMLDNPNATVGYMESGELTAGVYINRVTETRNGTLITSCYGWWKGDKTYSLLQKYVPELHMYKYRSWVIASSDRGKTWKTLGSPGYWPELGPEGMCEPGIVELANGDLLMLFRNGEGSQPCFQSRSSDGGLTWSKPEKLSATGCAPQPLLMSNGLLVASHGRPHYYLWVSPDGEGKRWTSCTLIGDGFGYTSVVEAAPGELVFVANGAMPDGQVGLLAWRVVVSRVLGAGQSR